MTQDNSKTSRLRKQSFKVNSTVESYTNFVLETLVGIKGTSVSNVINFILKDWIDDHEELLRKSDISVAEWRKSLKE